MKKNKQKQYSKDEIRAYYIGYGMGLVTNTPNDDVIDPRMGAGQHNNLCNSAREGFLKGKKNRNVPVFEKGHKKYPLSKEDYLKN